MPYILDNAHRQELEKIRAIDILLPTPLHYVDAPEPRYSSDETRYVPKPFRAPGITTKDLDATATIEIAAEPGSVLNVAFRDGSLRGVEVRVWDLWYDTLDATLVAVEELRIGGGRVNGPAERGGVITFSIGPLFNTEDITVPRRAFEVSGQADYKGPACGADGIATKCDKTYTLTGCKNPDTVSPSTAGGNSNNYCGFPMLPTVQL